MHRYLVRSISTACCGVAITALGSLASPARAFGLTGLFDPQNWNLDRYIGGGSTLDSSFPGPTSYLCGDTAGNPACVDITVPGSSSTPATFLVKGSTDLAPVPGPNDAINTIDESTIVQWSLQYNGTGPVITKFNFKFDTNDDPSAIQAYFKISQGAFVFDPFDPGGVDILASEDATLVDQVFTVNPGDTISYGVYTANNALGKLGILTIDGFDVQPVPAPLPLLGAGAAFGWSRRLRSRLRRPAAGVTGD